MVDDDISFQTWICPICHDDHSQSAACTEVEPAEFSPSPEDKSWIAEEYRLRVAERNVYRVALQAIRSELRVGHSLEESFWCKCWRCALNRGYVLPALGIRRDLLN